MDVTIFFAWQADRPKKLNHYLIRDAAKDACARITADPQKDWNVTLDSDTQGTPGMCDIPNTILDKIRKCDVFLADLTLVAETEGEPSKHLPNANVVFELGYAARQLGFKSLIGVVNEAFGRVEGQVFDIKRRACLKYAAGSTITTPDLKRTSEKLSRTLEAIIRSMIQTVVIPKRNKLGPEAYARQEEYIASIRQELRSGFAELVKEASSSAQGGIGTNPAFWDFVVRPSLATDRPVMDTLAMCRSIIADCQVGPSACPLPDLTHSKSCSGQDWIGGKMNNHGLECWRLTQKAVFAAAVSARELHIPPSIEPGLSLDDIVFRLTQVFRFAERLSEKAARNSELDVDIRLANIANRPLQIENSFGRYRYFSSDLELFHSWHCSREGLKKPDQFAVKAAYWFCERFNWQHVTLDRLVSVQRGVSHHM